MLIIILLILGVQLLPQYRHTVEISMMQTTVHHQHEINDSLRHVIAQADSMSKWLLMNVYIRETWHLRSVDCDSVTVEFYKEFTMSDEKLVRKLEELHEVFK